LLVFCAETATFDEQLALELLGDPFFISDLGKWLMPSCTVLAWWTASVSRQQQFVVLHVSIDSVINSKGSSRMNKEEKPLGCVYIPYVKGVSEKFKRIANRFNVRPFFRTKHILRNSLMKTRPKTDPQQTAECLQHFL
jgi:hypothetical protein